MGTPNGATIVRDDGTTERCDQVDAALTGGKGCVELHYAYGPDALPDPLADRFDMWRYARLLPVEPGAYPLSVGGTPLVAAPALRTAVAMPRMWLKDETRGPTGSNKDRATALVLQHAMDRGIETVSCASTARVGDGPAGAAGRR